MNLYSPRIYPFVMEQLRVVKQNEGFNLTWLANAAILLYVEQWQRGNRSGTATKTPRSQVTEMNPLRN